MNRKLISGLLLGAVGLTLSIVMLRSADAQNTPEQWDVEIDVFSGRPNPTMRLTADELAEAKVRLADATQGPATSPAMTTIRPSLLGYRGLVIRRTSGAQSSAPADSVQRVQSSGGIALGPIEVYRGKALNRDTGTPQVLDVTTTGLERYLITKAIDKHALPDTIGNRVLGSIP